MKGNHITWDEYFMGVALLSAKRSKDPHTKVGACIINSRKRIVGIGYNGFPLGCDDDEFPWNSESSSELDTKYPYVVHAEANAILNSTVQSLDGATIYVSLFPCNDCAKLIIQSGIKKIIYMDDKYKDMDNNVAARKMFDAAGVVYEKLEKKLNVEINEEASL